MNLRGHMPALDGLRGLAILLVLAYHQCVMQPAGPVDDLFVRAVRFGWCGVDLFFVLSGFLITGILLDTKADRNYLKNFYARRVLRIFPLYYAVVFFCLVILPQFQHPKTENFGRIAGDEVWYWLYLSNFSIASAGAFRHGILDISWSLAIEEQFYLFWPLCVLVFSRRALRRICLAAILVAFVFRTSLLAAGCQPISVYVLTPSRIDALAVGAWIAVAARDLQGGIVRLGKVAKTSLVPLGAALVGLWAWRNGYRWDSPVTQSVGYSLLAILFGVQLTLCVTAAPGGYVNAAFNSSFMRMFGKYSYALYLFHLPIRAVIRDTILPPDRFPQLFGSSIPGQLLFFVLATSLTLGAALLSWHLYEEHFLRLKEYFQYDRIEAS